MFDFSKFVNNVAIVSDDGKSYTYAQLQAEADKLKPKLKEGELAFCLCTNTPECIFGYVALLQKGVATVLLDANKDKELLHHLLSIYAPNWIWGPTTEGYILFRNSDELHRINPKVALLLTTSGSTGSPKLVKLTARNIMSNAESIAEYLKIDESERPITTLPMYYSFGMSVINSHLIRGATILLTDKSLMQGEFWNFLREQRATSMSGVPYTYEILKRLHFFKMELPYLKTLTQAGGKLNANTVREYVEDAISKKRKFIVMYGQTEAGPRISWLPFEYALEKYSSIGIAIPGGKLSIRDSGGNEIITPDTDGELIFSGPSVCMGYAECLDDLAKDDENHGVLHTGDIARMDSDGFFYITGRMKRFVKIWGNRCNLDAVEQLVKVITTNCACVGNDDKITIFVEERGLEQSIIDFLSAKMKLHPSAFSVKDIDVIPKKDTGKIDYPALQRVISK